MSCATRSTGRTRSCARWLAGRASDDERLGVKFLFGNIFRNTTQTPLLTRPLETSLIAGSRGRGGIRSPGNTAPTATVPGLPRPRGQANGPLSGYRSPRPFSRTVREWRAHAVGSVRVGATIGGRGKRGYRGNPPLRAIENAAAIDPWSRSRAAIVIEGSGGRGRRRRWRGARVRGIAPAAARDCGFAVTEVSRPTCSSGGQRRGRGWSRRTWDCGAGLRLQLVTLRFRRNPREVNHSGQYRREGRWQAA